MKLSIVIPVYNEEKGFARFFDGSLLPEVKQLHTDYEIIFVNDGSSDGTLAVLKTLVDKHKHLKLISLSRNFGKEMALTAGIYHATGDVIITIDADGQQPPELMKEFIKKWKAGAEIVTGVRTKYQKHGLVARVGSKVFYRILRMLGVRQVVAGSTDFRLISRNVQEVFKEFTEHNRITRGLIDWMGFKQDFVHYKYQNRIAGKPSFNFRKLVKLAVDSFVSLSTTPLIIFGWIGGFITVMSGLIGLFIIIQQGILGDPLGLKWSSATALGIFVSFLVGLVLISQAIMAIYISHIHTETKNRPPYIIDKRNSKL
jgi:dolichol-phosphate mannosyltransferase